MTYPDGKEIINATDEVKMNATNTMELMYPDNKLHWTLYVDPITSLVLTGLILYTTLGLLKGKSTRRITIVFFAVKFMRLIFDINS